MSTEGTGAIVYMDIRCFKLFLNAFCLLTWYINRSDPELLRGLEEAVKDKTDGSGRVEVLQLRAANEGGTTIESSIDSAPSDVVAEVEDMIKLVGNSATSSKVRGKSSTKGLITLLESTSTLRIEEDTSDEDEVQGIATKKSKQQKKKPARRVVLEEAESSAAESGDESEDTDITIDTADVSSTVSNNTSSSVFVNVECVLPDGRPKGMKKSTKDQTIAVEEGTKKEKKGKKTKRREKDFEKERKGKIEVIYF